MATAPGITAPRVGGGGSAGAGLRSLGGSLLRQAERKRERERKEREIFEKLTLGNEVDRAVREAQAGLPPGANAVEIYEATQAAGEQVVAGYNDQDPKQGQQAQKYFNDHWGNKTFADAQKYQSDRAEESLASRYAATMQKKGLERADALRRSMDLALTDGQRQAAAIEILSLEEEMGEYALSVDPDLAGNQVADWNRQAPIDAMTVFENFHAEHGSLVEFQREVRAGRYRAFRSRISPEDRRAMDEALSVRIGREATKRTRLISAQEAQEKAFQDDLAEKFSPFAREISVPQLRAQMKAAGATEATIRDVVSNGVEDMKKANEHESLLSEDGMREANNLWVSGLSIASARDGLAARRENDRRLREGLVTKDMHEEAESAIKIEEDYAELAGEENAALFGEVASRYQKQVGLRETVEEWDYTKNLMLSQFDAMKSEIRDVWLATGGEGGREALEALFEVGVAQMVVNEMLPLDQSNLMGGTDWRGEESTMREMTETDVARQQLQRHQDLIEREGWLVDAPLKEVVDIVSERTSQQAVDVASHTRYTEGGAFDRVATVEAWGDVPGLTEGQRAQGVALSEEYVNLGRTLKRLGGSRTIWQISRDKQAQAGGMRAEREIAEEEAAVAEAQAQAEPAAPGRTGRVPQVFATDPQPPSEPTDLSRSYEAYRTRRLERLEGQRGRMRKTPEQRALDERRAVPTGRGPSLRARRARRGG